MHYNFSSLNSAPSVNHEGAAFTLTPQVELYAAVATAALGDLFYEKANVRLERLRELVAKDEPRSVAKLAVYAYEILHLRSVPLVLCVELARLHRRRQPARIKWLLRRRGLKSLCST